ncbi:MAG: bifunctional precorrin-2 dehydrogenase/sirohydrochlorin ferrochelatase [Veillonella sp.]|uniref:precorrin-2 dehydrogenase/sirohydrochlorin ferrochelatase family protein n=1 Tax=Veillonella sp. TaxID=1926307 RepID=UPI00257D1376|nr:NAD(P)-dependent oxidoreductase [Veillonella sp.]MBS6483511.1 bifunctional precorrin-2 dehydrogenase/sirohydrochlorin ferrochelatase [Veillonella sp.]
MVSITFQSTTEDTILFVGGGEVAERRIQLFIDEPCNIVVIAPTVTDRICQWSKDNRITWYDRAFTMDDEHHIITSSLFFICTDNGELNDTLYDMGKKHRVWTNRSDYGQLQKAMPRLKIFREEVKLLLPTPEARQKFWRNHLTVETFEAILKGEWMTIEEKLDHEISGIRSKS